jgi:phage shock protein PspC (stress-responsive transcriptional regulator)
MAGDRGDVDYALMTTATTTRLDGRPLRRLQDGRLVGGVGAGIAEHFETEVLVIRVAFIGATLIGGVGAVLYVLAMLLVPRAEDDQAIINAPRRAGLGSAIALGLLALGGSILIGAVDVLGTGKVGVAAYLVALGLAALWWRDNMAEPPGAPQAVSQPLPAHDNPYPATPARVASPTEVPRGRSWTLPTLSLALIVTGLLALSNAADVTSIGLGGIVAAALGVVGVGLVASAFAGRGGGLIPVGIVLALVVATLASTGASFSGGFGEREWAPASVADIPSSYELGGGDARLTLDGLEFPDGRTKVVVEIGAGNVEVDVPDDLNLDVTGEVGAGNIDFDVGGQRLNDAGFGAELQTSRSVPGATSTLELVVDIGFGNIEIADGGRP